MKDLEILVKRIARKPTYTIGKMYIDGVYFCDTLEDRDRLHFGERKIAGKTAIPEGRYDLVLNNYSPRFGAKEPYRTLCNGYVPLIANVPQFSGVRIHIGNDAGAETPYKTIPIPFGKQRLSTSEYVEVV